MMIRAVAVEHLERGITRDVRLVPRCAWRCLGGDSVVATACYVGHCCLLRLDKLSCT
jgi:hypothetical protein